ncbi:G patch domain-containing protein TGH-like [Vitis vinifera]|uniref:G patch domain-containing protein TGH-like n=1 Tax=Vitis vinifera TaxID=29760 RepID=A0A438C1R5_VITVI|nr:G patch domain-containing protein TGH-like [Vitis vinifera]
MVLYFYYFIAYSQPHIVFFVITNFQVTDEEGRRRFHGAFTGGFSAGFYNTVGSKEGWAPQSFTSSRKNRAEVKKQSIFSFLDDDEKARGGKFWIQGVVVEMWDMLILVVMIEMPMKEMLFGSKSLAKNMEKMMGGGIPMRAFIDWELDSVECFLHKIQAIRVHRDVDDRVIWIASRCGNFSVKSLYSILEPKDSPLFPNSSIWRSCVLPKEMEGHSLGTSLQFDTFGFTAAELARKQAEKEQQQRPSAIPGPLPDEIVLLATESIGVKLLLKMGWRRGNSIKDSHTNSLYGMLFHIPFESKHLALCLMSDS